ncbi:lipopolysaccharide biosynthesis protein [Arenibacter sp. S6351L]|uniref:lipopolysaccharide biosynthesis protein n=1 Tax=Arenibacter sp. S6351L TaxID=2926407 RepID=UPI001FF34D59|nr:lipopolysaccharide biosynthesis protein [Arenibacter sp. S6351L]MCK0136979.1 lipopolysaccharide biosynthesis protein [Arenibacter sp. S6351L]
MSLKNKAITSFSWTLFEGVFGQGLSFIVGIILARILEPRDFGIVGILTVFLAISDSLVEAGFGSALIRKVDSNIKDYNTMFYTNLSFGVILYVLLFILSPQIAIYFDEPILNKLLKLAGLVLIINSFSLIQGTLLTKKLNFKTPAIISIFASTLSGLFAIYLAYNGYGVWSLVLLSLTKQSIWAILLWFTASWRPSLIYSRNSFKELFSFGYKLLIASLINTVYKNIYYIIIGKYFSSKSLGFYTRANQFQAPFSSNIALGIMKISFPILSTLQDDNINLKQKFKRFIRFSVFLNFQILMMIAAIAKPLILTLIGAKWTNSIIYLQLLCVSGMLYPLHILHLNLLVVKGYSNLNLKLEIIKKLILIPIILITVTISIKAMIYGLIIFSITEYFINSFYTKKLIGYSYKQQFVDILPFLVVSITTFLTVWSITFINIDFKTMLIIQLISGMLMFVLINEIFRLSEYSELKTILIKQTKKVWFKLKK